jgi:hypothetical protein
MLDPKEAECVEPVMKEFSAAAVEGGVSMQDAQIMVDAVAGVLDFHAPSQPRRSTAYRG